ncbi:hypothetical protein MSAN_00440000 [Mycena sanguinolenta]|uniref:Uncharacterized protein n=1 Tax=Mycena sanguinolenta TaxID=230812 RepID=A0A8H7DHE8_9AGAR|nr:hypothetical protein MSAN_00440000 [Mycena sanguinolenta]
MAQFPLATLTFPSDEPRHSSVFNWKASLAQLGSALSTPVSPPESKLRAVAVHATVDALPDSAHAPAPDPEAPAVGEPTSGPEIYGALKAVRPDAFTDEELVLPSQLMPTRSEVSEATSLSAAVTKHMSPTELESQSHTSHRFSQMKLTVKTTVLLTTFCAAAGAQMLVVIRDDDALKSATKAQWDLLNLTSYAAILLNALATVASALLIHVLDDADLNETPSHVVAVGALPDPNIKWLLILSVKLPDRLNARANRNVPFGQWLRPAIGIWDGLEPNGCACGSIPVLPPFDPSQAAHSDMSRILGDSITQDQIIVDTKDRVISKVRRSSSYSRLPHPELHVRVLLAARVHGSVLRWLCPLTRYCSSSRSELTPLLFVCARADNVLGPAFRSVLAERIGHLRPRNPMIPPPLFGLASHERRSTSRFFATPVFPDEGIRRTIRMRLDYGLVLKILGFLTAASPSSVHFPPPFREVKHLAPSGVDLGDTYILILLIRLVLGTCLDLGVPNDLCDTHPLLIHLSLIRLLIRLFLGVSHAPRRRRQLSSVGRRPHRHHHRLRPRPPHLVPAFALLLDAKEGKEG